MVATLDEELSELEAALAETAGDDAAFDGELARMRGALVATGRDVGGSVERVSRGGCGRRSTGWCSTGCGCRTRCRAWRQSMVNAAYSAAIRPVTKHFGGLLAQGIEGMIGGRLRRRRSFAQGRVMPFAQGGVVTAGRRPFRCGAAWG